MWMAFRVRNCVRIRRQMPLRWEFLISGLFHKGNGAKIATEHATLCLISEKPLPLTRSKKLNCLSRYIHRLFLL